ncbi:3-beta-hydroxysteroid dehydrogenase [Pleomassaria siparia CBS 279.74]|uniref:3-beta-hydroxysteroid dehydrogenase n=1 Tax=Pleomassaria siparia CBS 279.74 TaxID=1314801 RepID=A0A6G1JVG6_9PLEO|nr:3-beta-hydroxysteroid dehydrogenase [Pleomassaria siparia CBS 279.74]
MSNKVALITGGASGMGLAVATSLSTQGGWDIHILDLNPAQGEQTASSLSNTTFHPSDVTSEDSLASIFKTVYNKSRRIDFVFANAGIAEHANFFQETPVDQEPRLPIKGMHAIVDLNLKAVITTSYLALHYMRQSPTSSSNVDKSLIITASCGGLYPSQYAPIYTSTKHAVIGFMRSIATHYYKIAGIRVNAICPGTVKTNLLSRNEWKAFPEKYFTPVEKIAQVVMMLVQGKDKGGKRVEDDMEGKAFGGVLLNGRAVEISGRNHYYREQAAFCDDPMREVMGATEVVALNV